MKKKHVAMGNWRNNIATIKNQFNTDGQKVLTNWGYIQVTLFWNKNTSRWSDGLILGMSGILKQQE